MKNYDLVQHLKRQREFSRATFGPGPRTKGVIDHIRKELIEIEAEPGLEEWIDVLLLALDGAWRYAEKNYMDIGDVAVALEAKLTINENREWPDWRQTSSDKAIEHVRSDRTKVG